MNSRELKRAETRHRAKSWGPEYRQVPREEWPHAVPPGITRVFMNNLFVAMVYDNNMDPDGVPSVLVMIRPNNGKTVGPSLFRVMQDCKNQLFGPEARGTMYLPKVSELQDDANLYWFYVRKDGQP